MGEAKRRKMADPNFGRVAKSDSGRTSQKAGMGLVISSPVKISGSSFSGGGGLDPQELRFSLLFWDRFVWPANNVIYISGGPVEELLVSEGILTRPEYFVSSTTNGAKTVADIQLQAYRELSEREPGMWSLAHGERSFNYLDGQFQEGSGTAFNLLRAIPVPDRDVPIADILDFRVKRRDQLLALRIALETFIQKLERVGDDETALRLAVAEIESACIDVLKVASERQFPLRLANVKTSFSIDLKSMIGKVLASIATTGLGMPALQAVLLGMSTSVLSGDVNFKMEGDFGMSRNRLHDHPYRYVASYSKELFPY